MALNLSARSQEVNLLVRSGYIADIACTSSGIFPHCYPFHRPFTGERDVGILATPVAVALTRAQQVLQGQCEYALLYGWKCYYGSIEQL